ncbi:DMT family transporter [Oceanobacillus sp. 1P07AA]|uniref:DMT family transporter n=1 Tax=Oceanobacillus sp. 1P07AA TaxID=3132293 RepID=UPI0039A47E04
MNRYIILIVIGAGLWGTISWYVKQLSEFGFTPMEIVILRAWSTAIILVPFLLITNRNQLKLKAWSDLKYFIGTGILSIIFFNYCMFTAIELTTIPVATSLLYTAPAFVTILSWLLFKEEMSLYKIIALFSTLIGTCLVAGITGSSLQNIHISGILFGLGSGLGYALYSIFSKYALQKYSSLSVTTFTFIVAAVALIPFFPYQEKLPLLMDPTPLLLAIGLGFLPTALAYILYTYGLQFVEASKASILSTIEPIVATFIGIVVFMEPFSIIQFIGMFAIIGAVLIMQFSNKQQVKEQGT